MLLYLYIDIFIYSLDGLFALKPILAPVLQSIDCHYIWDYEIRVYIASSLHFKCFGADTYWYVTTFGNMDFNDEASFAEVVEKDVMCKCTRDSVRRQSADNLNGDRPIT